jgi:hypothetical protein
MDRLGRRCRGLGSLGLGVRVRIQSSELSEQGNESHTSIILFEPPHERRILLLASLKCEEADECS